MPPKVNALVEVRGHHWVLSDLDPSADGASTVVTCGASRTAATAGQGLCDSVHTNVAVRALIQAIPVPVGVVFAASRRARTVVTS